AGLRPPRNMDADFRRLAAFDLVPFGRRGQQLAVAVAAYNVDQQSRWQGFGLSDLFATLLDDAVIGELTQQLLQCGAVGVFEAELAGDLAGPDISRIRADKGDDGVRRWKAA